MLYFDNLEKEATGDHIWLWMAAVNFTRAPEPFLQIWESFLFSLIWKTEKRNQEWLAFEIWVNVVKKLNKFQKMKSIIGLLKSGLERACTQCKKLRSKRFWKNFQFKSNFNVLYCWKSRFSTVGFEIFQNPDLRTDFKLS